MMAVSFDLILVGVTVKLEHINNHLSLLIMVVFRNNYIKD